MERWSLTAGELWREATLSELLPTITTIGNFYVTGQFQNSDTQTVRTYLLM